MNIRLKLVKNSIYPKKPTLLIFPNSTFNILNIGSLSQDPFYFDACYIFYQIDKQSNKKNIYLCVSKPIRKGALQIDNCYINKKPKVRATT